LRKFYTSFLSKVTKNQEIKQGKIRENITKKGKKKRVKQKVAGACPFYRPFSIGTLLLTEYALYSNTKHNI